MYTLPICNTVSMIVKEKEGRVKESMRMMGMGDLPYWLSWFVYYTLINTVMALISWSVLCINVIQYSTPAYVFLWFWLYGESLFGQIIMYQAFFNRTKYAGLISAVI